MDAKPSPTHQESGKGNFGGAVSHLPSRSRSSSPCSRSSSPTRRSNSNSPRSFNGSPAPSWRSGSEVETLSEVGAFDKDEDMVLKVEDEDMVVEVGDEDMVVEHLEIVVEEGNTWTYSTGYPA